MGLFSKNNKVGINYDSLNPEQLRVRAVANDSEAQFRLGVFYLGLLYEEKVEMVDIENCTKVAMGWIKSSVKNGNLNASKFLENAI